MKIKSPKLPFTKKSALLACFFACMFIFASFKKEDILRIRKWKTDWKKEKNQKTDDFFNQPTDFPLLKGLSNFNAAPVSKAEINKDLNLNPNSISDRSFILKEKDNNIANVDIATENSRSFSAIEKEGTIGIFSDQDEDRAKDNFFTVNLPTLNENSRVFLTYELYGLASHESVSRSINHQLSIGGEIIMPSAVWSSQKEELESSVLKEGANTILFTSPSSGIKYKVRNLKIVFEKNRKENDYKITSILSGDYLYVKGISKDKNVRINNSDTAWNNGEFEKVIKLSAEEKGSGHFSVSHNGNNQLFKLPSDEKSFKVIGNNVYNFKTIDIIKDKEADINYEDLNLKVEKDAAESASLEIIKLREKDIPSVSGGLKNITTNNSGYRFSVKTGKLNKKVKITIPYDDKKLGLISPKEIKVFSFDYSIKKWKVVGESKVDQKNKTVTFEGDGDGDYINGVISVPESPQTNSFSPTTISGLQTADPTAGLQFLSPPTASQKGDANLTYPIVIPSGRNGLQPNLYITYSSNASNGWMGEGWNIEGISSIDLDTRWGAPDFDGQYETELYSLNGEMLVYPEGYLPHRHKEGKVISTVMQSRNLSGAKKFYLRRNHDFSIIERYGNSPQDYRWVITSTNGTKSYYGGDENSVDNQSVLRSPSGAIANGESIKLKIHIATI